MKACTATEPEIDSGDTNIKGNAISEEIYAFKSEDTLIFEDFIDFHEW